MTNLFLKWTTDYNPKFWIVIVKDWSETRPSNVFGPLGTLNFFSNVDIDNLLVNNSKVNSAFLIIDEQSLQKRQSLNYRALSTEVEEWIAPILLVYKDNISVGWVCISGKFNQIGLNKLILCCFWQKNYIKIINKIFCL